MIRHYLLALQFFTRIPITGKLANWAGYSPSMLRASAGHFPGIGLVIGGLTAACCWCVFSVLPQHTAALTIAIVFSTVFSVMLTGAFHEDGLADLADGLGGHVSRERSLEIMKDSRIGTYGAVALMLALSSKFALLSLLGQLKLSMMLEALFLAHVTSRLMPLLIIKSLAHVGDTAQSKSKPLADTMDGASLVVALVWWILALLLVAYRGWSSVWLVGSFFALLMTWWMRRFLQRRLDGFTGDALGATQQLTEIAFYFGALVAWH